MSKKTYPVIGNHSGGTSAVAGLLHHMGIFMGHNFVECGGYCTYEDAEFQGEGIDIARELVEERNENHDVWGWKWAASKFYIKELLPELRNPHVIGVTRDVTAIARSKRENFNMDFKHAWKPRENVHTLKLLKELYFETDYPVHLVSFEKLRTNPRREIVNLASFCDKEVEGQLLRELINFIYK